MKDPYMTAVIQAGGQSSRMGRDKALVPLGGKAMIEHVIAVVEPLADGLLIVTNNQAELAYLNLPMHSDDAPGAGALPGLRTALRATQSEWVLLVAVDMPFVQSGLLAHMLLVAEGHDAVVPVWADRYQPTCALYQRAPCLAAVESALAAGRRRMISWFDDVRVREVSSAEISRIDPTGQTFFNVNTPAELAQAELRLQQPF